MASKRVLGILSTLVCASLLAACAGGESEGSGKKGDGKLTFVAYGGDGQKTMEEAWQKPYMKKNPGVSFVNTSPTDVAQVKAQVEAGAVLWDVIATAPYAAEQNCGTLFEPLDIELTVPEEDLIPSAVGECYTANWINATPMAYLTDSFPNGGPETIEDFFDVDKFPGQRGFATNLQNGILEYASLASGVDPEDLYPLDVDGALSELDKIRSVTTFAPNIGALQQAVTAGQVDMFFLPDSRLVPLLKGGDKITIVWDVAVASLNAFAVPLGSTKKAAVEGFLASVTQPGPVAKISELLGVSPINSEAKPKLDEFSKQLAAFDPKVNTGKTVVQDVPWYTKNFNATSAKVTAWLAG